MRCRKKKLLVWLFLVCLSHNEVYTQADSKTTENATSKSLNEEAEPAETAKNESQNSNAESADDNKDTGEIPVEPKKSGIEESTGPVTADDTTPPVLRFEPEPGSVNVPVIRIICEDNEQCNNLKLKYNGLNKEFSKSDGTSITVELENKNFSISVIEVIGTDTAGNKTEQKVTYIVDRSAPRLNLLPKAGRYASLDKITVTCNDNIACEKIKVTAGTVTRNLSSNQKNFKTEINFSPALSEDTQVVIEAIDGAGNKTVLKRKYSIGPRFQVWGGLSLAITLGDLVPAVPVGFGGFLAADTPMKGLPWLGPKTAKLSPWLQNLRFDLAYQYFPSDPAYLEFMGGWLGPSWGYTLKPGHDLFAAVQYGFMLARALRNPQSAVSFTSSASVVLGYRYKGWVVWPFGQLRYVWLGDAKTPYQGILLEGGLSYAF